VIPTRGLSLIIPALLTLLLIPAFIAPASAEGLKPVEYDRSVLEKLRIAIEVNHEYVAGGFDDHGNWVISYAVKRDPDGAKFRELYNSTLKALQIWNASLRYYADKYNCSHLRKLILRFLGEANETNKPDVLVYLGVPEYWAWGLYYYSRDRILISYGAPLYLYLEIVAHEIGHSLGLGHQQTLMPVGYAETEIDFRGNYYDFELASWGLPSPIELYALCRLYEPIRDGRKPSLSGVIELPKEMNREYYLGVGVIQIFIAREDDRIVKPPTPFPNIYWTIRDWLDFPVSDLKPHGFGLYEGDVIVYPLGRIIAYTTDEYGIVRSYVYEITSPYAVLRDYGRGVLDAVVGFNISKVVYDKIYWVNRTKVGGVRMYMLGEPHELEAVKLPEGLSRGDVEYIVTIRGERCAPGECYSSAEWLKDGRILIRSIKTDLLVNVDVGKVYSFGIDVPFFGYNYTIRSPKMLREMVYRNQTYAPEGSEICVKPEETLHDFGNGTRIMITGWNTGSWNGTHLRVSLDKPVEVKALTEREHFVSVESPVGSFANVGWTPEGSDITVYPEEEVLDFGNGTRMVFKGFEGYYGKNVTLTVTSPVRLRASWIRQHMVSLESRYLSNFVAWADEGKAYLAMARKEVDFENGTLIRLRSLTACIGNETVKAEDLGDSVRLAVEVRRPVAFKALWDTYHMVEVSSEAPIESSCPGLYPEGSTWDASAEESIVYGNGTMRRFAGWLVNGQLVTGRTASFTVSRPLNIRALWRTYDYVTFMLDAGDGYVV
jgi:hypothetical protein